MSLPNSPHTSAGGVDAGAVPGEERGRNCVYDFGPLPIIPYCSPIKIATFLYVARCNMKKKSNVPESLRNEMRQAVRSRWARTTPAQRTEFAKMLWARRVQKHQQEAPGVRDSDSSTRTKHAQERRP
jgi:hypothetical protein